MNSAAPFDPAPSREGMVRMAYCYPERLVEGVADNGKPLQVRMPGHAKRPAYPHEINVWWEERP